jgi:hypothetical protein
MGDDGYNHNPKSPEHSLHSLDRRRTFVQKSEPCDHAKGWQNERDVSR